MSKKNQPKKHIPNKPLEEHDISKKPGFWNVRNLSVLVLLIAAVQFYPTVNYDLVNWDDNLNIYDNKTLEPFAKEWNWKNVKTIFTSDVGGSYNPLPIFTFACEIYFFASDPVENPGIFHFNNVWMHAVCTMLVFLLMLRLGLKKPYAFFAGLLFAIHPMRIESVAWVTERKDVLYGLFFVATLYIYTFISRGSPHKVWLYLLAIIFTIISLFAKVQAVILPLSMVCIDFLSSRKWYSFKILILEKLPWWMMSLAFGLLNVYMLRNVGTISNESTQNFDLIRQLTIGLYTYVIYMVKFIYPYQISPLYVYPTILPSYYYIALFLIPVIAIAVIYLGFKKKYKHLLFAFAFFTFNVMFLLQIVTVGQGFLADRFTYIAYIGFFYLAAYGLQKLESVLMPFRKIIYTGMAAYLLVLAITTGQQMQLWQNSKTLWSRVIEVNPLNPIGYLYTGIYLRDQEKDLEGAKPYFINTVKLDPSNVEYRNNLGTAYMDLAAKIPLRAQKDIERRFVWYDSALQQFEIIVKKESENKMKDSITFSKYLRNRGGCYFYLNQPFRAIQDYNEAAKYFPLDPQLIESRALAYIKTNQNEKAIVDLSTYIKNAPDKWNMYYERAICYYKLLKFDLAKKDLDFLISKGQTKGDYYYLRSEVNKSLGNKTEMKNDAIKARELGVKNMPEYLFL
ncbi:MAG: hypothetical protein KG003_06705 [Bacteroidetes bacterium]|nr:hypothetical protein [Bacteroidota bacterium]